MVGRKLERSKGGISYESFNKMVEYAYGTVFTGSIRLCRDFDIARVRARRRAD